MDKTTDAEKRYFAEISLVLRREGYQVERLEDGRLKVALDDQPICKVSEIGGITYRNEDIATTERTAAKDKIYGIARTTAEYMRQMEQAPPLDVAGLKERYRVLADFNGTVLACANGKFGVEFITWDWDFNRRGVNHGHFSAEITREPSWTSPAAPGWRSRAVSLQTNSSPRCTAASTKRWRAGILSGRIS